MVTIQMKKTASAEVAHNSAINGSDKNDTATEVSHAHHRHFESEYCRTKKKSEQNAALVALHELLPPDEAAELPKLKSPKRSRSKSLKREAAEEEEKGD